MSSEFVCRFCQAKLPAYVANATCPECGCSIDLIDNNHPAGSDAQVDSSTDGSPSSFSNDFGSADAQNELGELDALAGTDLGDFRLLNQIARRGMGVVYRAQEKSRDRFVALMLIDPSLTGSDAEVDLLETEARAATELEHPNIVPIHDVGRIDQRYFVSMGLVDGQSLADKVADRPLRPIAAAEALISICEAIEFAHQRGSLHRDLNLHNIIEDLKGGLHVADFGCARRAEQKPGDGSKSTTNSIGCMAPEQARLQLDPSDGLHNWNDVTDAVDVYGLGAVLYEMVSGTPPIHGGSDRESLARVIEQEPVRLSRQATGVPRDLETICIRCLQKDPVERYASVADLKADLERFIEGDPIDAKPPGVLGKIQLWRRMIARNPNLRLSSAMAIAGFPLVSIAFGRDSLGEEDTGHAKGIIAMGDRATGLIAYGGFARGGIAIGRLAVGVVSIGFLSAGVLSIGLAALGFWAMGPVAIGYKCLGLFSLGYKAIGTFSKSFASLFGSSL